MSGTCWTVLFYLLLMKITSHRGRSEPYKKYLREYLEEQNYASADDIGDVPRDPENLPEDLSEAEPTSPGHTLLQPSLGMLMSAIKFPPKENEMLVYGNLDNLGITFSKTNERVLYTGFRRLSDIVDMLLQPTVKKHSRKPILVYIRGKPHKFKNTDSDYGEKVSEDENNASETLDGEELLEANEIEDFRRKGKKHKYRERESSESTESDSSSTSGSSDYERNPGNPYTVFKDKYLQNWMWNHEMDGDHMNVNPYAPGFNSLGPSGAALFFNRKWWYYNQDDFRPFD